MKILHRYIIGRVVVSSTIAITALTLVLVFGNAFKRIFDLLIHNEVPLWVIFKMIAFLIPQALTFTIPWGVLVGILIVFGRLSHDLELQAVHSSGIGLAPLIAPVVLFSLVVTLICFYNNAILAPRAMAAFKLTLVNLGKDNPTAFIQAGQVIDRFSGYRIYVGKKNNNEVEDIHIWELDEKGAIRRAIRADRGVISANLRDLSLTITLTNVRQEERTEAGQIQVGMRAQQLPLIISLKDALDTSKIQKNVSTNTLKQLGSNIFNIRTVGMSLMPLLTELQKRFSFSFAPFTFVLVGIPLALQFHRRETSIGIVLSLGIVISYYLMVILAMALKEKAYAYPELIVWAPNLIFQTLGFTLLWKANYQRG